MSKPTPNRRYHHSHGFLTAASKSTTRHLAALDFLLNIPMANENKIKETGQLNAARVRTLDGDNESVDEESIEDASVAMNSERLLMNDDYSSSPVDSVGRKLQGAAAPTMRVPPQFRYNMLRVNEQSAVVRHWEDQMLAKGLQISGHLSLPLLSSRMFFSRSRAYPVAVFSVIKYDAGTEKAKLAKLKAEDQRGLEVFELPLMDWRGLSYKNLFRSLSEERGSDYYYERGYMYDPNALDDPDMLHGEHRYVQHPAAITGPIISSVILFVNHKNLKQSLNEQFRERHPQLPPSLTLSKIRNIKKSALLGCMALGIEVATTACGVIFFERLCLKGLITKANRRLTMAVSLLLSYKFNECLTPKFHSRLEALLDFIDKDWKISKKEVFDGEFGAFVHLGFSLHVPHQHIFLVCNRLLKLVYKSTRGYLGDDLMELYANDILVYDYERARESERKKMKKKHDNEGVVYEVDQEDEGDFCPPLLK